MLHVRFSCASISVTRSIFCRHSFSKDKIDINLLSEFYQVYGKDPQKVGQQGVIIDSDSIEDCSRLSVMGLDFCFIRHICIGFKITSDTVAM